MKKLNLQLFALKMNTKNSIVDYLKSQGKDSSFSNRSNLAKQYGVSNYTGTGEQNTKLLNMLKNASSANSTASAAKNIGNNTKEEKKDVKPSVKEDTLKKAEPTVDVPGEDGVSLASIEEQIQSINDPVQNTAAPTFNYTQTQVPTYQQTLAPTFNYTQQNTPTFNQVETPTYTAPTTQAQKATSLNERLDADTLNKMNSQFQVSQAYTDAMNYTNQLLQQLGGGKTSYTDQLNQIMSEYSNRDKFSYNADSDPLFQQALASAMKSGSRAMSDTMGQAAALTGGYGSSYATSAGANAYNQFIDEAYDNLPAYYQIAMDAYNQEGQSMLNQYNMLSQADSNEYNRLYNAYNANFNNAQTMYGNEYQTWADSVNNAYNYANMQNNDYWNTMNYDEGIRQYEQNFGYQQYQDQLSQSNWQNNFNYQQYADQLNQNNADRDFAFNQYQTELDQNRWQNEFGYGQYIDQLNQSNADRDFAYNDYLTQLGQYNTNRDYDFNVSEANREQSNIDKEFENWNKEFDYGKEQDAIANNQWQQTFDYGKEQDAIANSQWDKQFNHNVSQDAIANSQWEKSFNEEKRQYDTSLNEEKRQFDESLTEEKRQYDNYVARQKEIAQFEYDLAIQEAQAMAEAEGDAEEYKTPKEEMFTTALSKALDGGESALVAYCDTISDYDGYALVNYAEKKLTFTKTNDTVNGLWGVDHNDVVTDGYGQTYKISDIADALGLTKAQQKKLTKIKEGESINLLMD